MKKCFLTGLVTLLPVAVTLWIFVLIIRFLTHPFMGLMTDWLSHLPKRGILSTEQGIRTLSALLILVGLFFLIFFLGFIARRFFFNTLFKIGDTFLERIPLVNKVYKTSKEIVQSLFASKGQSFKQVVLLPFPYKGSYCLGLIASDSPDTCNASTNTSMLSIFIPTAPNPTTGFLVMIPKEELIYLDMKSEEAMKYIVSCAVIKPPMPNTRSEKPTL